MTKAIRQVICNQGRSKADILRKVKVVRTSSARSADWVKNKVALQPLQLSKVKESLYFTEVGFITVILRQVRLFKNHAKRKFTKTEQNLSIIMHFAQLFPR